MGRILAIDYGTKRVGLAVSDPSKLIANRLETVSTDKIINYLNEYFKNHDVELIVIGYPKRLNNEPTHATKHVDIFLKQLSKHFPQFPVYLLDERFTSKMAFQAMIDAGLKKKDRQNKELIDAMSATILLQNYLETIKK